MATPELGPPRVCLFDIGGVCVVSPFRAILDYEIANHIPPGWVNFSISRCAPNGAWHRLERGEIRNDAAFFRAFNADLRRPDLWRDHCARAASRSNAPVAPAPTSATIVGVLSAAGTDATPPLPNVDGEWLFWEMMRISREPDLHMLPAVRALKASGRFLVGALSNTSIFPDGHPFNNPPADPQKDVRAAFDVFVSSAHVGLRKPDPKIYELAMRLLNERWTEMGRDGQLSPGDVVFLDDIGENLKAARKCGMRTIKVQMGNTRGAVKELERITGMTLADGEAKL